MPLPRVNISEQDPSWRTLLDVADVLPARAWLLVGGLMVQLHAFMAGRSSRPTSDIDVLVDLLTTKASAGAFVERLKPLGFNLQEPALKGGSFHRLNRFDGMVLDLLVADHLPAHRMKAKRVAEWEAMEAPGGAQAVERAMEVELVSATRTCVIQTPDLLGALVLKCAAYGSDRRDRERHLEDIALLASCFEDPASEEERMHGSDRKRIRKAAMLLADPLAPAWMVLSQDQRQRGHDALRILGA